MRVKARTNIKYGDDWKTAGTIFSIRDGDLAELNGMVEAVRETPAASPLRAEPKEPEEPTEDLLSMIGDEYVKPEEPAKPEETREPERKAAARTSARKRKMNAE